MLYVVELAVQGAKRRPYVCRLTIARGKSCITLFTTITIGLQGLHLSEVIENTRGHCGHFSESCEKFVARLSSWNLRAILIMIFSEL